MHLSLHPMKFFALIMAILVLALSVMPCADNDTLQGKQGAKTELSKTAKQKDNPIQDDCSPFCHCACCAGFSINHTVAVLSKATAYAESHKTSFLPSEVIEIVSPIWQPPRSV